MTVVSPAELGQLRASCWRVATLREELRVLLRPGTRTRDLDAYAEERIGRLGARSAFKGYRGYPATVCVSVNEEVVHGIPGKRKLREGDLVSLDIGIEFEGFYSDTALSQIVGRADARGCKLIDVTRKALEAGVAKARAGRHVSDISHAIQTCVESAGLSVVREFVGHGIGKSMHEDPQIPNYGEPGTGQILVSGQALAIEPMVSEGKAAVKVLADGWTAVTVDGGRSAHWEHTVLVTDGEPEVLTVVGEERHA